MWGGGGWTPELTHLRLSIEVCILVLKRNRGYKFSARTLLRNKVKVNMGETNTNVPDEAAKQEIKLLFLKYKEYLLEETEMHQIFQHELSRLGPLRRGGVDKKIDRMEKIEA